MSRTPPSIDRDVFVCISVIVTVAPRPDFIGNRFTNYSKIKVRVENNISTVKIPMLYQY